MDVLNDDKVGSKGAVIPPNWYYKISLERQCSLISVKKKQYVC